MQILFLIEGRGVGGNETLLASLFQTFRKRGIVCHLACPSGEAENYLRPVAASVVSPGKTLEGWEKLLKELQVDLTVLVHGDIFHLAWASRRLNIPSIWMYGHPYWLSGWSKAETEIFGSLVNHLCAQSEFLASTVNSLVGKTSVIPNGVDLKSFHPLSPSERILARKRFGFDDQDVVLAYPARKATYKRHGELIKLVTSLRQVEKSLKLFFIGANDEKFNLDGVLARVVTHGEMRETLGACDLAVFPSTEEGYGCAIAECFAMGLPALLNYSGGHKEFKAAGEEFFFGEEKAPLAGALLRFLKEKELRKKLSEKAELFAKQLDREQTLDCYLAVFDKISKGAHAAVTLSHTAGI